MLRKLFLLAALAGALAIPASSFGAATGIVVTDLAHTQAAVKAGGQYVRFYFKWDGRSATPEVAPLADLDKALVPVLAAGMKPIVVVTGVPSTRPTTATYENFANFAGALAKYYAGRVQALEIWNEPDDESFWGTKGGDPGLYAAILKKAYPLVHPFMRQFVGGLTGNNYKFLLNLYDQLGGSGAGAFDGVAVHTDFICVTRPPDEFYRDADTGRISQYGFLGIREMHDIMQAHGDGSLPIWMTEIGWSTSKAVCDGGSNKGKKPGGVSEAQQAEYLAMAYHCLKDYPYVEAALWYDVQDSGSQELSLKRFGLYRLDGTQKPAFSAYQKVVAGQDVDEGKPCGDFEGPKLTVSEPTANAIYVDLLGLRASAADRSGIQNIRFFAGADATAKKMYSAGPGYQDNGKYPGTVDLEHEWRDSSNVFGVGPHVITVVATDGYGNPTTQNVTIQKVDPTAIPQLQPAFDKFTVTGSGRSRTFTVKVVGPPGAAIPFRYYHKLRLYIQQKRGARWRQVYAKGQGAQRVMIVRKTFGPGKYRVYAEFLKKAPFKGLKSKRITFTIR